jgi:hypothetical protein
MEKMPTTSKEHTPETHPGKEIPIEPIVDAPTKKEVKKFKAAIVDTTDLMRKQAEDVGNEKMTIEAESEDLAKAGKWEKLGKAEFWSRLGQKVWKYGLKRDYNRNIEIYKASEEILKEQNVFIGEGKTKDAHDKVMHDIIDQFTSGYDETIHKDAGELKVALNESNEEAKADKETIKQLIKDYATNKISKEAFTEEEKRIFGRLKVKADTENVKGNTMYASNLLEVAEQVKLAIKNGEFLENEDFEIDVIYGKSMASVRTEAHYTKTERIVKKMLHTEVGQFVNETSLAIALSCVGSLVARSAASLPGKVVPILGTAAISSWFANIRAKTEVEEKRKLHSRQLAKGEAFNAQNMPNRVEMEAFRYQTESATDILKNIDANLKMIETNGANLTEQELQAIFTELSALEAKIRLSDRRSIDLITYSDTTKVVEERKNVDIQRRVLKDSIQKAYVDKNLTLPNGQDFEAFYNSLATTEENRLISEENTGIDAKDRNFNKMKSEKGKKAAWTAFKTGIIFGATMQEVMSFFTGRVGIVEDITHQIKGQDTLVAGVGTENLTGLAYAKHLIQGDIPKMSMANAHEVLIGNNHIKLPQGVDMLKNPDGTYNLVNGARVIGQNLKMNPDGSLSDAAKNALSHSGVGIENHLVESINEKTVNPEEYVKNHSGIMKAIHRLGWFDNNTKNFDLNELRTHLGGINGTGIDANGNYVLDVSKMLPSGSFHDNLSVDAQKLMQAGTLKMLFSISKGTQGHGFEFTVSPKGEIIIPPGSDAGKVLFANIKGHLQFNGRYGEVAQDMGDNKYMILGTMEGKGLDSVIDTVKTHTNETILNTPGAYDGVMPPFIPIVPGDPLEKLKGEDRKKKDKKDKNPNDIVGVVAIPEGNDKNPNYREGIATIPDDKDKNPKDLVGVATIPEDKDKIITENSEKIEKKKTVNEISQEEYDAIYDDLKMINEKIKSSLGIITLSEGDLKSAYGKKRYMELKSILAGKPKGFNKGENELQTIGDELEKILSNSKIISQAELAKKIEKENKAKTLESDLKSDIKMINEAIRNSKGIITLDESSFKSDLGKERYMELESLLAGKSKGFNKGENELQTIGDELENYLVNYKKVVTKKIEKGNSNNESIINEGEEIIVKKAKTEDDVRAEIEKAYKIGNDSQAKYIKKDEIDKDIKEATITTKTGDNDKKESENKSPSPESKIVFNPMVLSKIGTRFVSKEGEYTITKISKVGGFMGMFSKTNVEVIRKDSKGVETLITYNKNDLEKELEKGNIQIVKNENNKKATENNIDEKDEDFELNKFINQISLLLLDATDEHLSKDPELKIFAVKAYPTIINDFKKDFESMNKKEEEETMEEFTSICKDKEKFIEAMKKFQKSGVLI